MANRLYIGNNTTIKFEYEEKKYCIHIQRDEDPLDPRRDWDNITTMACFHLRYDLGDNISEKTPEEFWNGLVSKCVSDEEFVKYLMADELPDSHVEPCAGQENIIHAADKLYDFWDQDGSETAPIGEGIPYSDLPKWKCDMSISDCMKLLENHCEWKNLWLYDHGGLTISTGHGYPYNDRWDSGQVGWIVISREEFSAWKDDPNWRMRADEIIDGDVKIYDQYLRGEVYSYTLYEDQSDDELDPEWKEIENISGFFGDDVMENGMLVEIRGLRDAILKNKYELGEAHERKISYWMF